MNTNTDKKCPKCGKDLIDGETSIIDGEEICDDCYFELLDSVINDHPIF